jgi:hypothetical protein
MRSRNLFAFALMAGLLSGFLGIAPAAAAEASGNSFQKPSKSARMSEIKIKRFRRGARIHLPIGPGYVYYDYPYYYSRGHYPTHIGGYVYYPYVYYHRYH